MAFDPLLNVTGMAGPTKAAGGFLGKIAGAAGPIGMGLSALSGIVGLFKSGAANRRNNQLVKQQQNLLDQQYLPDMNKRYLDTDQAQSFLATLRDRMNTQNQQVQQTAAVTGGTDEAVIAGREANAQNYGDFLNKLNAHGTQYKQGLQDRYMQGKNQILGMQMGQNAGQSESGSNLFSNAMGTVGNLAMLPLLKTA